MSETDDNLLVDFFNININEELNEECMICKEELSCYPCYTLPECKHKYHTHCLISWFRNGDSRCPYCGNKGINNKPHDSGGFRKRYYSVGTYEYIYLNDLRKFAYLKKNSKNPVAIKLQKKFEKIKLLENKSKENAGEYSNFKKLLQTSEVKFADAKKKIYNFRTSRWRNLRLINAEKYNLLYNSYIIPFIIPMTVDMQ